MKYKKIIVLLVFLLAFMSIDIVAFAQLMPVDAESIVVDLDGDDISISGMLTEVNSDVTIIVYRNSDNVKSYIDQVKTNENGEFSFHFSLLGGTYKAVLSCVSFKYTTNDIVVKNGGSGGGSGTKPSEETIPDNSTDNVTDITGHWAEDNIKKLITLGAIIGYPDGTFKPDNNITRAEFVTVLVKAFDLKDTSEDTFSDTRYHWSKDFIKIALSNEIVSGYGDDLFGPDDLITREQMAVIIVNLMKLDIKEYEISYNDKDQISEWAKKYVSTAVNEKLLVGYPDNTFRPKTNATRAEAVTALLNALDSIGK